MSTAKTARASEVIADVIREAAEKAAEELRHLGVPAADADAGCPPGWLGEKFRDALLKAMAGR